MLTIERIYYLCFLLVHLAVVACEKYGRSSSDARCTTNDQCGPIPNGKPYCNLETRRCEALRYCPVGSSNKQCPFNDLSAAELANVIKKNRKSNRFSSNINFPIVRKQEPEKKLWNSGSYAAKERFAYAAVQDLDRNLLSRVVVSLRKQRVVAVKPLKDKVAPLTRYEIQIAKELFLNDPRTKRAYERRGLNASYAGSHEWIFGVNGNGMVNGRRMVKSIPYYNEPGTSQMTWSPVEGLLATTDIANKTIIEYIDKGDVPVPKAPCTAKTNNRGKTPENQYPSEALSEPPIEITGYQVKWHNWKFQYSMDPIHGLQLYHIRYNDMFLIYKYSISEMIVPYGADGETWTWRGIFDAGEFGLGKAATSLLQGIDVPPNAKLLSCPQLNDKTGEVTEMNGCIAAYERNVFPLYRHYNTDSQDHEGIAGTELILAFVSSLGNYDYIFELIFSMDGNIEVRVMSTGIVHIRGVAEEKNDPNCIEDCKDFVNEHAVAPEHQHFFNCRIDFDIDGANNLFTEIDYKNDPKGPQNPNGSAFSLRRTIIRKETYRDTNFKTTRFWSTINPQSRNRFNTPRGYSIHTYSVVPAFLKPVALNQAMFIAHPIWVTQYNDDEQEAAGPFPRSGIRGQGLPGYVKNKESLVNTDLVVWHTFAITHGTRPEEFPFMNIMPAGFRITSRNFQSANPNVQECERESVNKLLKFL